jgi:hypothetical protein
LSKTPTGRGKKKLFLRCDNETRDLYDIDLYKSLFGNKKPRQEAEE